MAASHARAPSIGEAPPPRGEADRTSPAFSRFSARVEVLFEAERAQLPLWLPVGLLTGIAAWFFLPDALAWTIFLMIAGGAVLGFLALAPGTRWGRALAIFSLAAALGCGLIWWRAEQATAPRIERERLMQVSATVESVQTLAAEEAVRLVVRPAGTNMPAAPARQCRPREGAGGPRARCDDKPARLDHAARAHGGARRL